MSTATVSYDSVSKSVTTQDNTPLGLFFKPDGTKMYVMGYTNNTVYQYSLAANSSNATSSAFHNITINHSNTVYATSTLQLTSYPFNTENSGVVLSSQCACGKPIDLQ